MKKIFPNIIILSFLISKIISYRGCPVGYFEQDVYTCKKCPENSTPTPPETDFEYAGCKCTEENTAFDKINWECKKCPDDTTYDSTEDYCNCKDATQYFDLENWECKNCPSNSHPSDNINGRLCYCDNDAPQNFFKNECYTCPSDSVFIYTCICNDKNKIYDVRENLCVPIINGVLSEYQDSITCNEGYTQYDHVSCYPCPDGSKSDGEGFCTCDEENEVYEDEAFKCNKQSNYKCPTGQYLKYHLQKCVSCPSDATLVSDFSNVENFQYCKCNDNGKIFDFRNDKCISCDDDMVLLIKNCKKCPAGSTTNGVDNVCDCEKGNWDKASETCIEIGESEKENKTNDETNYGNFIGIYSRLLLIVFIYLF